jgi:hypothetical protein
MTDRDEPIASVLLTQFGAKKLVVKDKKQWLESKLGD